MLFRRRKLPTEKRPALARDEWVVAWASVSEVGAPAEARVPAQAGEAAIPDEAVEAAEEAPVDPPVKASKAKAVRAKAAEAARAAEAAAAEAAEAAAAAAEAATKAEAEAAAEAAGAETAAAEGTREVVVATNLGLWLPGRTARLGWHEVHKATWVPPRLTVIPGAPIGAGEGYEIMADEAPVELVLAEEAEVPQQTRMRVTRSVAHTAHHDLPGGGGVRVVARKVPRVDGVTWHVRFDAGTDVDDPETAAATAAIVAQTSGATSEWSSFAEV